MELLWPEQDPRKTANRLRVAFTALRKTLEPEIEKGSASAYLLREGDAYKLFIGEDGWVDVDEFRAQLKQAENDNNPETSIFHLLQAEAIYTGDFLAEDIYSEWRLEEMERLKDDYLSLLKKLMQLLLLQEILKHIQNLLLSSH